jgi:hypothetical protein
VVIFLLKEKEEKTIIDIVEDVFDRYLAQLSAFALFHLFDAMQHLDSTHSAE